MSKDMLHDVTLLRKDERGWAPAPLGKMVQFPLDDATMERLAKAGCEFFFSYTKSYETVNRFAQEHWRGVVKTILAELMEETP